MSELTIDVQPAADGEVLHLRGRATYREAHELRDKLFEAIAARPSGRVVLEMSAVEIMDTAALAVLVEGILATRRKSTELFFCTPSKSVREIFELTGLEEALTRCHGCLDDALKASAPAAA